MSINPASDIVFDVVKAADPVKFRVAAEKLSRTDSTNRIAMNGFEQTLATVNAMQQARRNSHAADGSGDSGIRPRGDGQIKAYKGLEQLVLKNLVETMLPKDSTVLYGYGTSGDIWRSFLADQLAVQVGRAVDLGVVPKAITAANSGEGLLLHRFSDQKFTADGDRHSGSM